jgi:hypothetical protein
MVERHDDGPRLVHDAPMAVILRPIEGASS